MERFTNKIFNYFKKKDCLKDVFRFMMMITIVSIGISIGFIIQFGTAFQQGCIFLGNGLEKFLKLIAHFDKISPGALSLTGTIIGAFIGFFGVILVFVLQGNYQKKRDKRRLMYLLLSVYENLRTLYDGDSQEAGRLMKELKEYQFNPKSFREKYINTYKKLNKEKFDEKLIEAIEEKELMNKRVLKVYENIMVYDKDWRNLIVVIRNIEDISFLSEFLLDLESGYIYDYDDAYEIIEKLKDILKRYGFRKHIKYIDKKILDLEEKIKKNTDDDLVLG